MGAGGSSARRGAVAVGAHPIIGSRAKIEFGIPCRLAPRASLSASRRHVPSRRPPNNYRNVNAAV
jgi:hypothetical protein